MKYYYHKIIIDYKKGFLYKIQILKASFFNYNVKKNL
jgi:hypothetical protein